MKILRILFVSLAFVAHAAPPREALPLEAAEWPQNYRLHLEGAVKVKFSGDFTIPLVGKGPHDVAVERPLKGAPVLRVWENGKLVRGPEEVPSLAQSSAAEFPDAKVNLGADFTAMATFDGEDDGVLFSKSAPKGKWTPEGKVLFVRKGRVVFKAGKDGELVSEDELKPGVRHTVVLTVTGGNARMWLDGEGTGKKDALTAPDDAGHILKAGAALRGVANDFPGGRLVNVRLWSRVLPDAEIATLFTPGGAGANTPDFEHAPKNVSRRPQIEGGTGWVQALERSDHAEIVAGWNDKSLAEGAEIYKTMCVICHGTKDAPGSLPTALRFAEGQFKNGADPFSQYLTLTKGFGQMVAQPQYTTAQKYAVIQYIRETFLKPHNKTQYTELSPSYLATLPRGLARAEAEKVDTSLPPYKRMDFGPALFWTYQIAPGNIAQKGIAIRLDDGPGGVSKGRAWMIYDHDTMRVAAATTGDFVDWRGIAFDGSHGTHTSLTGEKHFVNPVGPGWASPDGKWDDDKRVLGKDGKRYGPLPQDWVKFDGVYKNGNRVIISATINTARVLESPGWIDYGATPVFTRTVNVEEVHLSKWGTPLPLLRIAPDSVNVVMQGKGELKREDGFWVARLSYETQARFFISRTDPASLESLAKADTTPLDLAPLMKGWPRQWTQEVTTTSEAGKDDGPFAADTFPLPVENPWQSWMRPGGFDFTPDGKGAVVAMWNGDVWRVDGIAERAPAKLTWRRIASGLFQPLGVKFHNGGLFITCRDQIARLVDYNGDGETDFIQCFNNDAQVTEHFHEFAMGLQTDAAGNFYYAKSARHALDSVVPHHGTLLKVSADASKTEILATGFRAANGVCINDDGSFYVTDQEGHWTPKNRINRVKVGGFYGNMYGFTSVTDTADSAMTPPMVWVTNAKDRSPAELLTIPKSAWGNLGGALLNLSYGTGRAFIVPHEEVGGVWQGAVCELPMPAFATGIMRGRFGADGALYTSGMFAWAGNATAPGGFHRIRRSEKPAQLPLAVHATKGAMSVTFSDAIEPKDCAMKVWSLQRTKSYGSKHQDERTLSIRTVKLSEDKRTVTLEIPDLAPTHCYELKIGDRVLHGTIHHLK